MVDNVSKGTLIQHKTTNLRVSGQSGGSSDFALEDESASHQLVGSVRTTKAKTGSWSERMDSHTGTETRSRLLREAAVGNLAQWAKA